MYAARETETARETERRSKETGRSVKRRGAEKTASWWTSNREREAIRTTAVLLAEVNDTAYCKVDACISHNRSSLERATSLWVTTYCFQAAHENSIDSLNQDHSDIGKPSRFVSPTLIPRPPVCLVLSEKKKLLFPNGRYFLVTSFNIDAVCKKKRVDTSEVIAFVLRVRLIR